MIGFEGKNLNVCFICYDEITKHDRPPNNYEFGLAAFWCIFLFPILGIFGEYVMPSFPEGWFILGGLLMLLVISIANRMRW
jgi:hypothetical protein